jgi:hypothetical protein
MRAAVREQAAKADAEKMRRGDAEKNKEEKKNANDQCPSTNDQRLASMLASISSSPPFSPPSITPNKNNIDNAPLLPPTVPSDVDPDAKPTNIPQLIQPEKIPAPIDPNKVDLNKPDAPNVDPTKIIAPSTPDLSKTVSPSTPAVYPQHPEAVVIVDKFADSVAKDASWSKIRSAVQRMQRDRPGLIVRVLDRRDAANYPVQPNELPAIITTSEGRIETKLDKTLLETVTNDPPAFPWQALLSLFTGGFSWVGVGALGIWAIAMIRRWRIAQGKKILVDNESAGRIRELLEKLFERIGEKK